uniref:Uncharacterized protein n=1 Tax=Ananas comosus var. bracteatus TaxID=296719 RepID=A0A6V7QW69_ANACO
MYKSIAADQLQYAANEKQREEVHYRNEEQACEKPLICVSTRPTLPWKSSGSIVAVMRQVHGCRRGAVMLTVGQGGRGVALSITASILCDQTLTPGLCSFAV